MTAFEVGWNDGSVFLLACCIPDIQFGRFLFECDIFHFEIYGGDLSIFLGEEISLGESPEESCFSDIAITDNDYFIFLLVFVDWQVPIFYHY